MHKSILQGEQTMVYGVQDPQALYNKHGINGFYDQYGLYNNQSPSLFGNGYAANNGDDGKISFTEKAGSFFKGIGKSIVNGVKSLLTPKGLLKTAATIGACMIPGVGPLIGLGLAGIGVVKGVSTVAKGASAAASATTDEQAKQAWENIGSGTFTTVASAVAVKGATKAIGKMNANASATSLESVKDATGLYNKAKVVYKNTKTTLKNASKEFTNKSSLGKSAENVGKAFKNGEGISGKLKDAGKTALDEAKTGYQNVKAKYTKVKQTSNLAKNVKDTGKTIIENKKQIKNLEEQLGKCNDAAQKTSLQNKISELKETNTQTLKIAKESIESKSKLIADSLKEKATESGWDTKDLGTVYISNQLKEANSEYEMYNEYLKSVANSNTGISA